MGRLPYIVHGFAPLAPTLRVNVSAPPFTKSGKTFLLLYGVGEQRSP